MREFLHVPLWVLVLLAVPLSAQNCSVVDVDFMGPFDGHQLNVCDSEAPVQLMDFAVTPGGTFSGNGVQNNVFYPAMAGAGNFPLYYVMGTDSCEIESKVLASTEQAEIFPLAKTEFCADDAAVTLEVNPPAFTAETFIFVNDLFTFLPNAVYDPAVQGPGTDTLVYQFVELTGNGCKSSDTVIVTVAEPIDQPNFTTAEQSLCVSADPILLEASPPGGVFRSDNAVINGDMLDPTASGAGEFEIYYVYSDALNICTKTDTLNITVEGAAVLSFDVIESNCDAIPDTLMYTGEARDPGVSLLWDISDYNIVGNQGDSVIYVQWEYPGIYSVGLSASNNNCSSQNPDDNFYELPDRSDFICKNVIWAPNAFTPNGDGNNDEFILFGENIDNVTWSVHDRWGEKVWQSNQLNDGWNGEYKGSEASNGVYYYFYEVRFFDQEFVIGEGTITLIR